MPTLNATLVPMANLGRLNPTQTTAAYLYPLAAAAQAAKKRQHRPQRRIGNAPAAVYLARTTLATATATAPIAF